MGQLSQQGDRVLITVGGLSAEVLITDAAPADDAALADARARTAGVLAASLGQAVRLRGVQSDGFLLSAKLARGLGSTPASPVDLDRFRKIEDVISRHRQELMSFPGVIGLRPGYQFRDGWITDEPCIVAVTRRKLPDSELPASARLPERIEDVPVDVANATPLQQVAVQAAQAGRDTALDPLNPEGYALPTAQSPGAEVFSAELVRTSRYVPPPGLKLDPVSGPFNVLCHASPDAGWRTLSPFLAGMQSRLTVAMYDFTAPHIMRGLEAAAIRANADVSLILDPGVSLNNGDEPNNPKSGDFSEDKVRDDIEAKLKDKFAFVWAAVSHKGKVAHGIFPTAYHIKVAVRDGQSFWLSSGNWQSSNQPDIDPLGKDAGLPNVLTTYNREWHVIVDHSGLADTYERFIQYDEQQAK
ncbi:MAG: hypothetical protein JOZ05_19785, partial [Acetobacteraceae bacterium]|nr:hypothetical protein [Acetobacteraceae bacterium]